MTKLTLKVFVHDGGKLPQKGKEGDAGIDVFARTDGVPLKTTQFDQKVAVFGQFDLAKIPLGFSYAFEVDGETSHDYWLDIRNRSGVGTKSGFVTVAEVGDANYRGELHYCAVKVTRGDFHVGHGDKIAQALINPFVDPHKVDIVQVNSLEELGASSRGAAGFGSSGK